MARKKSKNTIARDMFDGWDFEDLSGGKKAAVTKRYNAQTSASAPRARARATPKRAVSSSVLRVEVGRIGNGPMKAFAMNKGTTVQEILDKADITLDVKKEAVLAQTTGNKVHLGDEISAGEVYVITPEIESAE